MGRNRPKTPEPHAKTKKIKMLTQVGSSGQLSDPQSPESAAEAKVNSTKFNEKKHIIKFKKSLKEFGMISCTGDSLFERSETPAKPKNKLKLKTEDFFNRVKDLTAFEELLKQSRQYTFLFILKPNQHAMLQLTTKSLFNQNLTILCDFFYLRVEDEEQAQSCWTPPPCFRFYVRGKYIREHSLDSSWSEKILEMVQEQEKKNTQNSGSGTGRNSLRERVSSLQSGSNAILSTNDTGSATLRGKMKKRSSKDFTPTFPTFQRRFSGSVCFEMDIDSGRDRLEGDIFLEANAWVLEYIGKNELRVMFRHAEGHTEFNIDLNKLFIKFNSGDLSTKELLEGLQNLVEECHKLLSTSYSDRRRLSSHDFGSMSKETQRTGAAISTFTFKKQSTQGSKGSQFQSPQTLDRPFVGAGAQKPNIKISRFGAGALIRKESSEIEEQHFSEYQPPEGDGEAGNGGRGICGGSPICSVKQVSLQAVSPSLLSPSNVKQSRLDTSLEEQIQGLTKGFMKGFMHNPSKMPSSLLNHYKELKVNDEQHVGKFVDQCNKWLKRYLLNIGVGSLSKIENICERNDDNFNQAEREFERTGNINKLIENINELKATNNHPNNYSDSDDSQESEYNGNEINVLMSRTSRNESFISDDGRMPIHHNSSDASFEELGMGSKRGNIGPYGRHMFKRHSVVLLERKHKQARRRRNGPMRSSAVLPTMAPWARFENKLERLDTDDNMTNFSYNSDKANNYGESPQSTANALAQIRKFYAFSFPVVWSEIKADIKAVVKALKDNDVDLKETEIMNLKIAAKNSNLTLHKLLVKFSKTQDLDAIFEEDEFFTIMSVTDSNINLTAFESFSMPEIISMINTRFESELKYFNEKMQAINSRQLARFISLIEEGSAPLLSVIEIWRMGLCDQEEFIDNLFLLERCLFLEASQFDAIVKITFPVK